MTTKKHKQIKIDSDEFRTTLYFPKNITFESEPNPKPKIESSQEIFQFDIFPATIYSNIIKIEKAYIEKIGKNLFSLTQILMPLNLLTYHVPKIIDVYYGNKLTEYSTIQNIKCITPHPFNHTESLLLYSTIKEHNLLDPMDNILIISKDEIFVESIVYYQKYVNYNFDPSRIKVLLVEYRTNVREETYQYLKSNNINFVKIRKPFTNDVINSVKNLVIIQSYYSIQTFLSIIIIAIKSLKKYGSIIAYIPICTNHLFLNLLVYIAQCFESHSFLNHYHNTLYPMSMLVVFRNYLGNMDEKYEDMLNILNDENYSKTSSTTQYLSQLLIPSNPEILVPFYSQYKKNIINLLNSQLQSLQSLNNLYLNYNKMIVPIMEYNLAYSVRFAHKYSIELLPNIDIPDFKYFKSMLDDLIVNSSFVYLNKFLPNPKKITMGIYDKIKCEYYEQLKYLYFLSESVDQYLEKINYKSYKRLKKFINGTQKELNNMLYEKYGMNINGHVVSRAWIKMYEILSETKFLDNITNFNHKVLNGFHICEIPGNFISCIDYYTKHNTNIKKYKWIAQSLAPNLADFFDSYGFIKKTRQQWDLGANKNGNIMDFENIKYYVEKYHGVDIITGDCGEKWSCDYTKNLATYQLIYAMLIPRMGGNFIMKTFYTNIDKQYLSLLYIILSVYKKVYVVKSNTNFWSPEIYIVGIDFLGLDEQNNGILWRLVEELTKKDRIVYSINNLPKNFLMYYEQIMQYIASTFSANKKFFVWLSKNQKKNKERIRRMIRKKNNKWLERFMKS